MHGLRHPVLQQRLPARQPHPGLERPRLPRPLARRASTGCTPRTTSPSSPAGSARRRARRRACSASTRTRSRSSRSRSRSSTAPGTRAGSTPVHADRSAPASGSRSSARGRPGWPPRSSSPAAGHDVVVFERADRIGGLLRYGIPEFKMEKRHLDRRIAADAGRGHRVPHQRQRRRRRPRRRAARRLRRRRARRRRHRWRDLPDPRARARPASTRRWSTSRWSNKVQEGDLAEPPITAAGKRVVIIGGGDTGADCLGTAHPPGRGVDPPVRDPAAPARRAARRATRGRPGR